MTLSSSLRMQRLVNACVSRTVFEDRDIPGEERTMRATEIQQLDVVARDGDDQQLRSARELDAWAGSIIFKRSRRSRADSAPCEVVNSHWQ